MVNQEHLPADEDKRREFLIQILESEENRRTALDNRCGILLAANAILLTGVIGYGVPAAVSNFTNVWDLIKVSLAVLSVLSAVFSIVIITQITAPLAIYQKERERLLDLGKSEFNLFFFLKVADYKRGDYIHAINSLSEGDILEQLAAEVHNVSRILQHRLPLLRKAHLAFVIGIIAFALLALLNLV
jgi:hypothetical protein